MYVLVRDLCTSMAKLSALVDGDHEQTDDNTLQAATSDASCERTVGQVSLSGDFEFSEAPGHLRLATA